MQILGKVQIQGKEKEILLKEEDGLFKYYSLELVGVYTPKMPGETIIFRQDTLENYVSAEAKDNEQKNKMSLSEKEQMQQFLERIKVKDIINNMQIQEREFKSRSCCSK